MIDALENRLAIETLKEIEDYEGYNVREHSVDEVAEIVAKYSDLDLLYIIGYGYDLGEWGLEQDQAKAFHFYDLAAKRLHQSAMFTILNYYRYGWGGVTPDPKKVEVIGNKAKELLVKSGEIPAFDDLRWHNKMEDTILWKEYQGVATSELLNLIEKYNNSYIFCYLGLGYKKQRDQEVLCSDRKIYDSSMMYWFQQSSQLLNCDAMYYLSREMKEKKYRRCF